MKRDSQFMAIILPNFTTNIPVVEFRTNVGPFISI